MAVNSSNSSRHGVGLRAVYDCACPGHNAIYECTVSGAGTTVWGGEAFDCPGTDNVINLRHRATINSMSERECSSGAITGRLIHAQPEQGLYTSQLMVNVSSLDTNGTTIECYYDNGSTVIEVGTSVLTTTRGMTLSAVLTIYSNLLRIIQCFSYNIRCSSISTTK